MTPDEDLEFKSLIWQEFTFADEVGIGIRTFLALALGGTSDEEHPDGDA